MSDLTTGTKKLLVDLIEDAGNWSGIPGFGCNVGGDKESCGYLTHLKKAGYIQTDEDEGVSWVYFTPKGHAWARENCPDHAEDLFNA